MDAISALAVLSVTAGTGILVAGGHFRLIGGAHEDLVAGRAASSRLERVAADAVGLAEGERPFELSPTAARTLANGAGAQTVTRVEPGLYEIAVTVRWGDDREVRLTTRVAREETR